jgi:hypothetical protein
VKGRQATAALRGLAEAQHGVVSTRGLLELGVGEEVIQARLAAGSLISLHQGVFALGHRRLTAEGEWLAAVLACGPGAVLSHASAGHLWGVCRSRGPTEVLRTSGGGAHTGIRLHQTRRLDPFEVTMENGIPVTCVERTMLDLAGRSDNRRLERMVVQAYKSGMLSWPRLGRVLQRRRGRKGAGRLRRIALEVDPRALETRSVSEVDFLALCRDANLPTPAVNVLVRGHLVDFLWSDSKVIVESDSWRYHGDRPAFERDHQVDVDLIGAGYDVHRTTYKMLERDPGPFLNNVRRALRRRTASTFPPASPES